MKPSDFVSTSGEKQDMSQSVLQTELTDAVNSGIVENADKSEKSLKSGLYSVGKRASTGGAASAALAAVTNGRKGGKTGSADGGASPKGKAGKANAAMAHAAVHSALEGSELEGMDDLYNSSKGAYRAGRAIGRRIKGNASSLDIKGAVRNAGKGAVISGVRGTFQESELEGVDNVYDGARAGYHVVRGVKKRLSGKNPISSDKSLGKLSEKKSAIKAADTVEAKRKAQAAGYFKKSVYKASADVQAAGNVATSGKVLGAATAAGGKSGLLIALGAASPVIIMAVIIILLLFAALTGLTGEKANEKSVGSLQGVPAEVALYIVSIAVATARAIQLYVMAAFSPIPLALLGFEETRQSGISFLKNFCAACLAGAIMMFLFAAYPLILTSMTASLGVGDLNQLVNADSSVNVTGVVDSALEYAFAPLLGLLMFIGLSILLIVGLVKAGSWAKEILGS